MIISARAKLNWALSITGRRLDGYHLLDTIMQKLTLCDTLEILPGAELSLAIESGDGLAADESNLVYRAAAALRGSKPLGAKMRLTKRIPMGAGLGGGSADAAAALTGLNRLWNLGLSSQALSDIALTLGADVPYCLMEAPARARGIGEALCPIPCARRFPVLLLKPAQSLSTQAVFARYRNDRDAQNLTRTDIDGVAAALASGDLAGLKRACSNALEAPAGALLPVIGEMKQTLLDHGAALSLMTGSGSVVFGVFEDRDMAESAQKALSGHYRQCILTETV